MSSGRLEPYQKRLADLVGKKVTLKNPRSGRTAARKAAGVFAACDFCGGQGTATLLSTPTNHRYCHDRTKLKVTVDVCRACLSFIDRTTDRKYHRGYTRCAVCEPLSTEELTAVKLERARLGLDALEDE